MNKQLVILGGGFAGVEAAIKMKKYGYPITLVSDRDYLFVYRLARLAIAGARCAPYGR